DGIRDKLVTGVQTCALPILAGLTGAKILVIANAMANGSDSAFTTAECEAVREWVREGGSLLLIADHTPWGAAAESLATSFGVQRSEERRVGKECGSRGWVGQ